MPATVARLPNRPSRPTIKLGGNPAPLLEAALLSYRLHDTLEDMASAELEFGNWAGGEQGNRFDDRRLLDFGTQLSVEMDSGVLFSGRISAIEGHYPEAGPPTLSVRLEDGLQSLRMARRTRSFPHATLESVTREVVEPHGLTANVTIDTATAPLIAQVNQTDFALLLDLARRFGGIVTLDGDTLHIRKEADTPAVELRWAGTLRAFDASADLAGQRSLMTVSGWDVGTKQAANHTAGPAAMAAELDGDLGGASLVQSTFGEREEVLAHCLPATQSEAREIAESAFRHMARGFVTGEGLCETDPLVRVGAKLVLSGLGPIFDGKYRAISVTHLFAPDTGAVTEFRCDRPGIGSGS